MIKAADTPFGVTLYAICWSVYHEEGSGDGEVDNVRNGVGSVLPPSIGDADKMVMGNGVSV